MALNGFSSVEGAYRIFRDTTFSRQGRLADGRRKELCHFGIVVHSGPRLVNASSAFNDLKEELNLPNKECILENKNIPESWTEWFSWKRELEHP